MKRNVLKTHSKIYLVFNDINGKCFLTGKGIYSSTNLHNERVKYIQITEISKYFPSSFPLRLVIRKTSLRLN